MTQEKARAVPGAGRKVGAGLMAAGAILVLFGLSYLMTSVAAVDEQAADLDPSERRLERSFLLGTWGAGIAATGLALFVVGVLPYAVSAHRVNKHAAPVAPAPRVVASVAALVVAVALLFGFLAPMGPFMQAASLASGGGGPAGAVQLEGFAGNLTSASFAGSTTEEAVHPFTPVAEYGSVKLKFEWASEGAAPGRLIAVLEAANGNGGWEELGATDGSTQAELDIPARSYAGALRVRVTPSGAGLVQASYGGAIAFDPTP